jgi:hypothetical protein
MNVVDRDANGDILSLDFRGQLSTGGVVPEPSTFILLGTVLGGFVAVRLRRAHRA